MNQIQTLEAEIVSLRQAHATMNDEIFNLLKEQEQHQLRIDYLSGAKEIVRRELGRLRQQKHRTVTGRN